MKKTTLAIIILYIFSFADCDKFDKIKNVFEKEKLVLENFQERIEKLERQNARY